MSPALGMMMQMMPAPPTDGRVQRPLKVVYIMGSGHIGSSILGVAVGNCDGIFYAGEVEEWLVNDGVSRWGGPERSRFWDDVAAGVGEIPTELRRGVANRVIERSSAALRVDRWAARRRLRGAYRQLSARLLRSIARSSAAEIVVDSSHSPLRARELERADGIELFLVYLVRDPQSVVASYVRAISVHEVAERRARILAANAGLWLTQLMSIMAFLRHPRERRMFVRYEQLLADPEGVLRELLARAGSRAPLPDLGSLDVGITLEGSRLLRNEGTVALQRGATRVSRWSLLTALVQSPWEAVFERLRPAVTARQATSSKEADGERSAPGRERAGDRSA